MFHIECAAHVSRCAQCLKIGSEQNLAHHMLERRPLRRQRCLKADGGADELRLHIIFTNEVEVLVRRQLAVCFDETEEAELPFQRFVSIKAIFKTRRKPKL